MARIMRAVCSSPINPARGHGDPPLNNALLEQARRIREAVRKQAHEEPTQAPEFTLARYHARPDSTGLGYDRGREFCILTLRHPFFVGAEQPPPWWLHELYDHREDTAMFDLDVAEYDNVAARNPAVVAEMRAALETYVVYC